MTHRHYWLVIPAAGIGQRMAADTPKQYLRIDDRYIIDITLSRLLNTGHFAGCIVVLHPDDTRWPSTDSASDERVVTCIGGAERVDSVRSGLDALSGKAAQDDWVLVHDVARPCLSSSDLTRLIESLENDPVGGLLAVPVSDTIKRSGKASRVQTTVSRADLWRAMTPQQFRYGLLVEALGKAQADGVTLTDESSAVEAAGHSPRLIEGRADNIKITVPEDLALAGWILRHLDE
ncbi:2-C-methyl-D-erythritol 4-phosphate cytidylyltransferase [Marinobacter sp. 1Y8]